MSFSFPSLTHLVLDIEELGNAEHLGSEFAANLDDWFPPETTFHKLRTVEICVDGIAYVWLFSIDRPCSHILRRFASLARFPLLQNLDLQFRFSGNQTGQFYEPHGMSALHWPEMTEVDSFDVIKAYFKDDVAKFLQAAPPQLYIWQSIECSGNEQDLSRTHTVEGHGGVEPEAKWNSEY